MFISMAFVGTKPLSQGSVRILGLPFSMAPFTKMSFFTDKKEVQKSATALGYVAHVCSVLFFLTDLCIKTCFILPYLLCGLKSLGLDFRNHC
jgi:hypothetical protein